MLHIAEPEFATIQNTPAVTQIQNAIRDTRTLSSPIAGKSPRRGPLREGGTAVTLSAERGTRRFAIAAGVLLVSYEPWSSSIFRSLTE
jgi:hypothetical protein